MSDHGTYDPAGPRPALRFERALEHPVERVWRAIADPGERARWFPTAMEGELRPGAPITQTFAGDDAPSDTGHVVEAVAPDLLAFTWFGDLLTFELEPAGGDGGGTILRFAQRLSDREAAARTAAGWAVCLDRLTRALAGEDVDAPGTEPTAEWHAHYARCVADGMPHGAPVPGR